MAKTCLIALHLLVDCGIASTSCHPDLLVEVVTDGIWNINGGIRVCTEDSPGGGTTKGFSALALVTSIGETKDSRELVIFQNMYLKKHI